MPTAIIFGASGQDGPYVAQACQLRGFSTVGVSRSPIQEHYPHIACRSGDIRDRQFVEQLIRHYQPALVFHLAAQSTTRHEALFDNHETIATGTLNLLESVRVFSPKTKVFITGSGVQFENQGLPIHEQTTFAATNSYAIARIQSVYAARYFRTCGVQTYVGYLFHHDSPRRQDSHVSQLIASSVRKIVAGEPVSLVLGDISVQKEWTYAGDVAEAILTLIMQDQVVEAVIGSGKAYSIEDWLTQCFGLHGLDWRQFTTLQDGFKAEYPLLVSDPTTIYGLGWRPTTDFGTLAQMMCRPDYTDQRLESHVALVS